jgi:hypothetical protein
VFSNLTASICTASAEIAFHQFVTPRLTRPRRQKKNLTQRRQDMDH